MYEAGYSMQVEVISYTTFEKMWFNYNDYIYRRKGCAFGSVIDIESGLPESCPMCSKSVNMIIFKLSVL